MRFATAPRTTVLRLLLFALLGPQAVEAQSFTQEIALRPGWNAVFLEVQPADNAAAAVFAGLPVESVWTRRERITTAEFIQNQNEVRWNDAGWLVYRPPTNPDAFVTTLHAVQANRPYLVQLGGTQPVTWRVAGRPSLRHPDWVPDAFNLRGFPVDQTRPPRFVDYFREAPAHFDRTSSRLEEIHRLGTDGRWRLVAPADLMASGEAFWVYSRGASRFTAPLTAEVENGGGLDFDYLLEELTLRFHHVTPANRTVTLAREAGTDPPALAFRDDDFAAGRVGWTPLPPTLTRPFPTHGTDLVRLAIRRQYLTTETYEAVLRVTDGAGTRLLIPVLARRTGATVAPSPSPSPSPSPAPAPARIPVGLWVGAVQVNAVSEVRGSEPDRPTPAKSGFPLRLLLHIDADGRARLLKEVVQMWEDGTYIVDNGVRVPGAPGRFVWLTDPRLIPRFRGAILRDGVAVGRRLTSVGFDFDGGPEHLLPLVGEAAVGRTVTGTIALAPDFPTNPFRHPFHPDHDNLDERFENVLAEAYSVTRRLELAFAAEDPTTFSAPDYGYGVVGGVYRETLTGLHHRPIHLEGSFRLRRLADAAALNPQPRAN